MQYKIHFVAQPSIISSKLWLKCTDFSIGLRQLNVAYTQTYNRVHRRVGHIFHGRY